MSEQLLRIIENRSAFRSILAALPPADKIVFLEKFRLRSIALGAGRSKEPEIPSEFLLNLFQKVSNYFSAPNFEAFAQFVSRLLGN